MKMQQQGPRWSIILLMLVLLLLAALVGSTSAFFLYSLEAVSSYRLAQPELLYFLPAAGLIIVFVYQTIGKTTHKGINLLFQKYFSPQHSIPLRTIPIILGSTLVTHLFGGSAGREGTALQYGGTWADILGRRFAFSPTKQRMLLLAGIAAGFGSLFGTPWAAAIFAVEVVKLGKIRFYAFLPALFTAFLADAVCTSWGLHHTRYTQLVEMPDLNLINFLWAFLAALIFSCTARAYILMDKQFKIIFLSVTNPYRRIFLGSLLVMLLVFCLGTTKHLGLGIPTIQAAFYQQLPYTDFLIKMLLTTLTLAIGFKGGEVTPLFFIGATLGNALSVLIPLPLALLAAMGFCSVFAGCTKTPLACTIMAIELFGISAWPWFALSCGISFCLSGIPGIYDLQKNTLAFPQCLRATEKWIGFTLRRIQR